MRSQLEEELAGKAASLNEVTAMMDELRRKLEAADRGITRRVRGFAVCVLFGADRLACFQDAAIGKLVNSYSVLKNAMHMVNIARPLQASTLTTHALLAIDS